MENLTSLFSQAAASLDAISRHHRKTEDEEETLFIHWTYHPKGLQRSNIRQIFNKILQPHLTYKKVTIAISSPKKLRDILTRAALSLPNDCTVQNKINLLTNTNHTAVNAIAPYEHPNQNLLNKNSQNSPFNNTQFKNPVFP